MNRIIVFLASLLLIASLFLTTSCTFPVNPLPDDGDTSQGEGGSQNSGNEENNENIDGGSNNNDNANQDDNTNGDDNSGDGTEDGNKEIIYEIPADKIEKTGTHTYVVKNIPITDYPLLLTFGDFAD